MLKKDKQKVLGEVFDDERVKSFLDVETYGDLDVDHLALLRAYRGMKADNFATFVRFFTEEGRNINALSQDGKTLLQDMLTHRHAEPYVKAMKNAGAR